MSYALLILFGLAIFLSLTCQDSRTTEKQFERIIGRKPLSELTTRELKSAQKIAPARIDIASELSLRSDYVLDEETRQALNRQTCSDDSPLLAGVTELSIFGTHPTLPISVARDPVDGVFYVAAGRNGEVLRCIPATDGELECTPFTVPNANGFGVATGLWFESERRLLWVTTRNPSALFSFSVVTGKPLKRLEPEGLEQGEFLACPIGYRDSMILMLGLGEAPGSTIYRYDPARPLPGVQPIQWNSNGQLAIASDRRAQTYLIADPFIGLCIQTAETGTKYPLHNWVPSYPAGICALTFHKEQLIGVHNAYGPPRIIRYQLSDGIVGADAVCIDQRLLRNPVHAVVDSDTLFVLTRSTAYTESMIPIQTTDSGKIIAIPL